MRRLTAVALLGSLTACSGNGNNDDTGDDGTQTPLACDSVVRTPIGQVNAQDWPAGVAEALPAYEALDGLYEGETDCVEGDVQVRITTGSGDVMDVVEQPWPESLNCGCTIDPELDADSKYDVIAIHDRPGQGEVSIQIYFRDVPDPTSPGGITFPDGSVTVFAPGEPMSMRGCATKAVDPIQGSDYERYDAVLRRTSGAIEADLVLHPASGGESVLCQYRNLTFVE